MSVRGTRYEAEGSGGRPVEHRLCGPVSPVVACFSEVRNCEPTCPAVACGQDDGGGERVTRLMSDGCSQRVHVDPEHAVADTVVPALFERRIEPDHLRHLRMGMNVGQDHPGARGRFEEQLRPEQAVDVVTRITAPYHVLDLGAGSGVAKIAGDTECQRFARDRTRH